MIELLCAVDDNAVHTGGQWLASPVLMSSESKNPRVVSVAPAPENPRQIKRASGFVEDAYSRIREDIMSLKIPPSAERSR